jgi:hypothetical protein
MENIKAVIAVQGIQEQFIWMNDLLKSKVGSSKTPAVAKKENDHINLECKQRLEFFLLQFSLYLDSGYQTLSVMNKLFSELEFFVKAILNF